MSSALKIYALFIGSALLMFGGGLQGLLLSARGAQEGFSLLALGLIGTGWSVGFIAGSLMVPMVVKRAGHIRAYSVMAAIGTVTILLNLLWINDISWIVLRAFSGFCFAGAAMIVESWLNEVSDNRSRGTIFSIYTTINMAASTIGLLAISVTGVMGHVPFVVGAISFICAVVPFALTSTPQPRPIASARIDVWLLYRTSPLAVIASFACGIANGTFGTLAPVYGVEQGLVATELGVLFAVTAIVGAIAQIPFGRLSDSVDRRIVLVVLSGIGALVGLITLLTNPDGWLMYLLFAGYGFSAYPLYAIAVAHANDFAREGEFARVAGAMLVILGAGLAIGPLIASLLMQATGRAVDLFVVTAAFHGALAVTAFLRMKIRPVRDASGRVQFRIMSAEKGVSPGTVTLDPRAEEVQELVAGAGVPTAASAPPVTQSGGAEPPATTAADEAASEPASPPPASEAAEVPGAAGSPELPDTTTTPDPSEQPDAREKPAPPKT